MNGSICIPKIELSTTKEYILNIFNNLNIGKINRIIEIPLRTDPKNKRIIIQLKWGNSEKSIKIQEILNTGSVKLVHDMPWYWKIVKTESQKNKNQ